MPRLKPVDPATATGKAKEIFDGPLKGKDLNIFKSMANSPALLQAFLAYSGGLREGVLEPKERELIQLAVSEANGCSYCVSAHSGLGKQAGLSDDQVIAARKGQGLGDLKLDALAHFAVALHEKRGYVSNEDVAQLRSAGYADSHIAEAVGNYALATFTNYFNHVNQTPLDIPEAPQIS